MPVDLTYWNLSCTYVPYLNRDFLPIEYRLEGVQETLICILRGQVRLALFPYRKKYF